MTVLLTLVLLACAPVLVCYLVWGFEFPKGVTSNVLDQATNERGERTMPDVMAGPDGERLRRWMEEGRNVFDGVRRLLHEYDQLKVAADASRQEGERLQQNCEELRQEVKRLRTEAEFVKKQRAESAQWFAAKMNEGASRLRIERPAAGTPGTSFCLPRPGENT